MTNKFQLENNRIIKNKNKFTYQIRSMKHKKRNTPNYQKRK